MWLKFSKGSRENRQPRANFSRRCAKENNHYLPDLVVRYFLSLQDLEKNTFLNNVFSVSLPNSTTELHKQLLGLYYQKHRLERHLLVVRFKLLPDFGIKLVIY